MTSSKIYEALGTCLRSEINFQVKLFFSYFFFAIALSVSLTFVHFQFSEAQREERFMSQAKELMMGKVALLKEYVLQGSPSERLSWLMEHLHASESFEAYCLDSDGKRLTPVDDGFEWQSDGANESIKTLLKAMIDEKQDDAEFVYEPKKQALLLPLKMLESPNGTPFMLYKAREKRAWSSYSDNLFMVAVMGVLMALLSFPFAYFISKPLRERYGKLDSEIKIAAIELTKKDRLLYHQSKLAAIGEMIGNISHQWRLPLTRMQMMIQNMHLLQKDEKLQNLFVSAKEQIAFMTQTIDTFSNFYRSDGDVNEFLISECIHEVEKIIGATLKDKGVLFCVEIEDDLRISGSKNELGQVLLNIISNAKYELETKKIKEPFVKLNAFNRDGKILITIEDNAGGIPSATMPNIFEPYFSTKNENGSGLGLYMSKVIMEEKFGGEITARNTKNGALFEIALLSR